MHSILKVRCSAGALVMISDSFPERDKKITEIRQALQSLDGWLTHSLGDETTVWLTDHCNHCGAAHGSPIASTTCNQHELTIVWAVTLLVYWRLLLWVVNMIRAAVLTLQGAGGTAK